MTKMIKGIVLCAAIFSVVATFAQEQISKNWEQWIAGVRTEALAEGVRPALFDDIFSSITAPNPKIIAYDHHQPEKRMTFLEYRNTRVNHRRVVMGARALTQHQSVLDAVAAEYGVSPCIIVALWGMETSYGAFVGSFPVIQSLATLAYDSPRAHFFRKELICALHIVNDGHIDNAHFKGEWAGASGQPQFLPSSWKQYAVDYDHDGRKDIWTTLPDVFASMANYLVQNGWKRGEPWAIPVTVPASAAHFENSPIEKTVADWEALGITSPSTDTSMRSLRATLIRPDGGPDFLIFNNFRVIMKWNHSTYYAGSVGYAAEQICHLSSHPS